MIFDQISNIGKNDKIQIFLEIVVYDFSILQNFQNTKKIMEIFHMSE